jgi:CelD/BcsL family acetyltransferase involved in cellulose biosynthesis
MCVSMHERPERLRERRVPALGLRVQIVDSFDGLLDLERDYAHLNEVGGDALPFALHDWHVTWWRHFSRSTASLRDELMFHVVRDEERRCVAIVPLVLTTRGYGRFSVGSLAFLGPDRGVTDIRGPLVAPGMGTRVAWAVRQSLAEATNWDWIQWSGISGSFGEGLAVAGRLQWQEPIESYVLSLPSTWDAFDRLLKRNVRESLRRGYDALARDRLELKFTVAQTPADVRQGLACLLTLHSGQGGPPGRFADAVSAGFLYEVCARLAAKGVARVFVLEVGNAVVAARIAFQVQGSLYLYDAAFDSRWAKYGVMATLTAEILKYAIAANITTANLSTDPGASETGWPVRAVRLDRAREEHPRIRSRVAFAAYRGLTSRRTAAWAAWFPMDMRAAQPSPTDSQRGARS